jgi:hypothetical protein
MSAGKGDKLRPFDRKKFEENYDQIFRKPKVVEKCCVPTDISYSEYKKCCGRCGCSEKP